MSDQLADERFSDEEVEEILKRAVSARRSGRSLTRRDGVSLKDLAEIGTEVGIDAADLESAARAVVEERRGKRFSLLGAPLVIDVERVVPGTTDPSDAPTLLAIIRKNLGHKGEASEIQGSLEWSAKTDTTQEYVTLSSSGGRTTLRASTNITGIATALFLPIALMGTMLAIIGFVAGEEEANAAQMILSTLFVPGAFAVGRTIFARIGARRTRKLEGVVDELSRAIAPGDG